MQLTLKQVLEYRSALDALAGLTLPAKLSFAIRRNADALAKEADRVEQQRQALCIRYADKDENGDSIVMDVMENGRKVQKYCMSDEACAQFAAELGELINETVVEVDVQMVNESILEKCDDDARFSVPTVAQIAGMSFMLESDDNAETVQQTT